MVKGQLHGLRNKATANDRPNQAEVETHGIPRKLATRSLTSIPSRPRPTARSSSSQPPSGAYEVPTPLLYSRNLCISRLDLSLCQEGRIGGERLGDGG
jgi:hypothetical protein